MTTDHPLVHRYLTAFEEALAATAPDDRADIVAEIRQHIADAQAAGRTLDDILNALGPVDALARQAGLSARVVQGLLMELELDGKVWRHPGGSVSLR